MNFKINNPKNLVDLDNINEITNFHEKNDDFEVSAVIFKLFDGVHLIELNTIGSYLTPIVKDGNKFIEINYVINGRAECEMDDGCLQYLGQGDILVRSNENFTPVIKFPLYHYSAISIIVDKDKANYHVKKWFCNLDFDLTRVFTKLFKNDCCLFIQSSNKTRSFFDEIDLSNRSKKQALYRLKILELFLFLDDYSPSESIQKSVFTRNQAEIVKEIHDYLITNLDKQITILDISKKFPISQTTLKTYFKSVYGKPIANYVKEHKIQQGQIKLCNSDDSILEISLSLGYKSQSKFSQAFKEIVGLTPTDYRNKVKKH